MKLCLTIVETRNVDIVPVINRHRDYIDYNHDLVIWTTGSKIREWSNLFPEATFFECEISELGGYNRLLTSVAFWEKYINYDRVLIFQSDSGFLRFGIQDFFEYSYVGAPWGFQARGGNGGLSLRDPNVMLQVINNHPWKNINEDVYFCNTMYYHNLGNLAPRDVCLRWGIESVFSLGTLTYHAIDKWLTPEQVKQVMNQYK